MKSLVNYIKKDKINFLFLIISLVFFIVVMAIVGSNFFGRFGVELEEGFRDDGVLYFTVGRGIANGLRPYVDLFETKGPMLFYLCALGYLISGPNSFYFINVFSFVCLITIALIPVAFIIIRFVKEKEKNYLHLFAIILSVFTFSFLLVSYIQRKAGRIYAETFCSFYVIIAFFILYLCDEKKLKFYSPTIIICGILFCLTALTKETFALIAVTGTLFICRTKRDLIYKFLLPFSYGVVFAFIFLLATNILVPYFTIYYGTMLNTWLPAPDEHGLPFVIQMINFPNVIVFMWKYSPMLTIMIIIEFIIAIYLMWRERFFNLNEWTGKNFIICLLYALVLIFITPFILALGTPSLNHQHAAGLPIYILLLLYIIDKVAFTYDLSFKPKRYKHHLHLIELGVSIASCLAIILLPTHNYISDSGYNKLVKSKECAAYVDEILNVLGEKRYQYIGMFELYFYAYTTHTPLGPCFFQTPTMFSNPNSYLVTAFKQQIESVDIIIVTNFIGVEYIDDWLDDYLDSHFTDRLPDPIKDIEPPESFAHTAKFLFRAVKCF